MTLHTHEQYGSLASVVQSSVKRPNKRIETPAHVAAANGDAAAIAELYAAGANMNTPNKDGETPTYVAAERGHVAVIAVLHAMNTPVSRDRGVSAFMVFVNMNTPKRWRDTRVCCG